jgi:hypothetical protein
MTDTCGLHGITGLTKNKVREVVCEEPTYRVGTPPCTHPQHLCFGHFSLVPLMQSMTCEKCNNEWDISTISWAAPPGDDDGVEG